MPLHDRLMSNRDGLIAGLKRLRNATVITGLLFLLISQTGLTTPAQRNLLGIVGFVVMIGNDALQVLSTLFATAQQWLLALDDRGGTVTPEERRGMRRRRILVILTLWMFTGGIAGFTVMYGWHTAPQPTAEELAMVDPDADPSIERHAIGYGRENKVYAKFFEQRKEGREYALDKGVVTVGMIAGVCMLAFLTLWGIPISTSFMLVSIFAMQTTIMSMLVKSGCGYAVAFAVSCFNFVVLAQWSNRFINRHKEHSPWIDSIVLWRMLQLVSTGLLFNTWLKHDLVNASLFFDRYLTYEQMLQITALVVAICGLLAVTGGGPVSRFVKVARPEFGNARLATCFDLSYAIVLIIFKDWSDLPMSTTLVFMGMLAGRDAALAFLNYAACMAREKIQADEASIWVFAAWMQDEEQATALQNRFREIYRNRWEKRATARMLQFCTQGRSFDVEKDRGGKMLLPSTGGKRIAWELVIVMVGIFLSLCTVYATGENVH